MALSLANSCIPSTFSPSFFGASILAVEAHLVTNYSASVPEAFRSIAPSVELKNATFCNVTVTYTHPGQNDTINTEAWLPLEWNDRFLAVGGGGWLGGRFLVSYGAMEGAIFDGFATITTDAGLGPTSNPDSWALLSPGNVNLYNLQNLGSTSLIDQAVIGKSIIKSFYGRGPKYSYWNGCSQGGRQGLMLAQRYPDAFDGIAAGAPAIYWNDLLTYIQWPQQVMNELARFPHRCELSAINTAAIKACDGLDGVVDGTVARTRECLLTFDPFSVVGETVPCAQKNGTEITISLAAAIVVNATWHGRTTADGKQHYYGIPPGADMVGSERLSLFSQPPIVATTCNDTGCTGAPNPLGTAYLQLFLAKDTEFNIANLTRVAFDSLVLAGSQQYNSFLDTSDPDLERFRAAGGKMVSWHGLADGIIPPEATETYYKNVAGLFPDVQNFYRYYEVPGMGHCYGGTSGVPTALFQQLRDWVENGTAPEQSPVKLSVGDAETHDRIICPYPQVSKINEICGNAASADCWSCISDSPISTSHI